MFFGKSDKICHRIKLLFFRVPPWGYVNDLLGKTINSQNLNWEKNVSKTYVNLLYLGMRAGRDVARVHEWAEIDGIENDGSELPKTVKTRIYGKKRKKNNNVVSSCSPGSIYKFEQEGDSIFGNTATYQGFWKNKTDCARWQAESRARDYEIDAKVKEKKDNKRRVDLETLDTLASAYYNLVGNQKTILLAEIIKYLTTWHPGKSTLKKEDDWDD